MILKIIEIKIQVKEEAPRKRRNEKKNKPEDE